LSGLPGTWLGLQFEATLHAPPLVLVQVAVAAKLARVENRTNSRRRGNLKPASHLGSRFLLAALSFIEETKDHFSREAAEPTRLCLRKERRLKDRGRIVDCPVKATEFNDGILI